MPAHGFVVITNMENAASGIAEIPADNAADEYCNISIFPNPASSYIRVNSNDVDRIEVYSLAGQMVASATGDNQMDISALTAGTYIVRIYTSQGVQAQKLLKR